MKLSIIVPYFKTYDLTVRLLNGLIPQLTKDSEVIIVDDGCHEERLNKFMDINGKVTVIHLEENGGVSKARNTGIKNASGKYVSFIDSDDMITMDYLENLLSVIDNRDEDVIIFNWLDTTNNTISIKPYNCAVWKAIYKKDIIPFFDETLRVREDYFFQKELEKINPSVYYYNRVLYMYNSGREGSLWWNATHK